MVRVQARRLRIHGHVQGVGYRYWFEQAARSLGINGWVRNRSDETVEAVISGPQVAMDALIKRAHDGPRSAVVQRIDQEAVETTEHTDFMCLPTL